MKAKFPSIATTLGLLAVLATAVFAGYPGLLPGLFGSRVHLLVLPVAYRTLTAPPSEHEGQSADEKITALRITIENDSSRIAAGAKLRLGENFYRHVRVIGSKRSDNDQIFGNVSEIALPDINPRDSRVIWAWGDEAFDSYDLDRITFSSTEGMQKVEFDRRTIHTIGYDWIGSFLDMLKVLILVMGVFLGLGGGCLWLLARAWPRASEAEPEAPLNREVNQSPDPAGDEPRAI